MLYANRARRADSASHSTPRVLPRQNRQNRASLPGGMMDQLLPLVPARSHTSASLGPKVLELESFSGGSLGICRVRQQELLKHKSPKP